MVVICDKKYQNTTYNSYFDLFRYELSDFQKFAIQAIVDGCHALVTAPTGSGKSLPAEFAIQHFVGRGKKVIYTSPIKALSNQKYSDFTAKYPDIRIGISTGDFKCNPDADVIIMTTEILMNALFLKENGGESDVANENNLQFQIDINNELACVVFDEVHMINDADRGHVWEKTILMLPEHVQMVMLSATIDAPERFAEWIEKRNNPVTKQVYLCPTYKRIVPLSHYGYLVIPESGFKLFKDKTMEKEIRDATRTLIPLQNDKGAFSDTGYKTLSRMTKIFDEKRIQTNRKHVLNDLGLFLRDREMLPAIAFVFSRKQVEKCASEITVPLLEDDSKVPYTVRRECEQIIRKLPNYQEYMELPEYGKLVSLLEKGVGIHHSGMIPILREIVEIMISKRYIKLLFATESFAIGLDCPIKTAIFTSMTKFDGSNERLLLSHEYTQMAGRAGRRGIDTIGHVVHCNNLFPVPSLSEYKTILGGKPQTLVSKFRISHSVILNLMRNGKTRFADFADFVRKSMISGEIASETNGIKEELKTATEQYDVLVESLKTLRTPESVCRQYMIAEEASKTAVNKKRKELDRTLQSIRDAHKFWKEDVAKIQRLYEAHGKMESLKQDLEHINEYMDNKIHRVCDLLINNGFMRYPLSKLDLPDETSSGFELTPLGQIATGLAEVDPLFISEWIVKWNWFESFSPKQLVGLFSIFTNVNAKLEERRTYPFSEDNWLKSRIIEVHETFQRYEDFVGSGEELIFDMTDFAMEWCDCSDEHECKLFIQTKVAEKGISIGDFTKAMMKISTIAKEILAVAEAAGEIGCVFNLTQIDGMILKYVTASQSLYI